MAKHGQAARAGDGMVRAGAVLFALGVVAIVAVFAPFALDLVRYGAAAAQRKHEHGLALNLATFLTCVGMGLALLGLLRQARAGRVRD